MASTTRKVIQSIEALSRVPQGLTATELGSMTGLSWQAASRTLEGLLQESIVVKDEASKKYQLTLRVCEWASSTIQGRTGVSVARKECVRLALRTGRRLDFLVLEGLEVVVVERCEPADGVPLSRFVSARRLWYESASGRAIIAFSPQSLRTDILERTFATPGLSLPKREELEVDLDQVREQGFAVTPVIYKGGSTGIVAPVRDRSGFAVAAISLSFPAGEVESEAGVQAVTELRACAAVVSQYLGFEDRVSTAIG